jgi:2-hydroxy-4-carboxymuconate semialdehyde hemiacetal dehydrogenase
VEIPLADTLQGAEDVVALAKRSGLVAMCGHTRRFNPSHQYVLQQITAGKFNILQMDVQTYFFRSTNANALGQARNWIDHLLWHYAAHTGHSCESISEASWPAAFSCHDRCCQA